MKKWFALVENQSFFFAAHFKLGNISVFFPYSWVKLRPGKRELLRTHRQKRGRFEPSFQPHPVLQSQPPDFKPSMLALYVQHVTRTVWIKNLNADAYIGVFSHHISNSNTNMGRPSSVRPVPANVHLHTASVHLLFVWELGENCITSNDSETHSKLKCFHSLCGLQALK